MATAYDRGTPNGGSHAANASLQGEQMHYYEAEVFLLENMAPWMAAVMLPMPLCKIIACVDADDEEKLDRHTITPQTAAAMQRMPDDVLLCVSAHNKERLCCTILHRQLLCSKLYFGIPSSMSCSA